MTNTPPHNAPHPGLLVFARMADALEGRPLPGTQAQVRSTGTQRSAPKRNTSRTSSKAA